MKKKSPRAKGENRHAHDEPTLLGHFFSKRESPLQSVGFVHAYLCGSYRHWLNRVLTDSFV